MISWKLSIAPDTLLIKPENCNQSRINRLPITKVEHFLDFLFSSNLMQDVAYGVNKIEFERGDEQKVANSILTMKYSHTIACYRQFCSDTSFEPFSESTLWRILTGINPSQRKGLASLDDITAAGMNGFSTPVKAAERIKRMDLAKDLETGKRYLKAKFLAMLHLQFLYTSSTSFSLSD